MRRRGTWMFRRYANIVTAVGAKHTFKTSLELV
jgi:hypothetical protein